MANLKQAETSPSPVSVVRYAPGSLKGEVLAPRGSIVVYLATAGSDRLDAIRAAARGGSLKEKLLGDVDSVPRDAATKISLHYGDHLLAADVPVPGDGSPVRLILPYNGGELIAEDLVVREGDSQGRVAAVAVVHDPPVSRVEQAALLLVPRDRLHLNLGAALGGGIAGTNDEERRRQEEARQRQEADDVRQEQQVERAQAMAEAQGERAELRAEQREERRAAGGLDVHFLDQTVIALGPPLAAAALLDLRRDLLRG